MKKHKNLIILGIIGIFLGICLWAKVAYCQTSTEDEEKGIYKDMLHQQRIMAQSASGVDMEKIFNDTSDFYMMSLDDVKRIYNRWFYRSKDDREQAIANRMREKYANISGPPGGEEYYKVGKEIMDEFGINEDEFFEIELRNFGPN